MKKVVRAPKDLKLDDDVEMLKKFKKETDHTYDTLGKALGVHYRTVYLWLAGKTKPSPLAKEKLKKFLKRPFVKRA